MPFTVTESALTGRRPAVIPNQGGGFSRVQTPDPNSGMATYKRSHGATATRGMDPTVTASGESAASANQQLMLRALMHAAEQEQQRLFPTQQVGPARNMNFQPILEGIHTAEHRTDPGESGPQNPLVSGLHSLGTNVSTAADFDRIGAPSPQMTRGGTLRDPRYEALKQALFENGADHLATGAKKFGDNPGFFDMQNNRNLQRQALAYVLRAGDLNDGRG